MKKHFIAVLVLGIAFLLGSQTVAGQTKPTFVKPDCFTTNRGRGDSYRLSRKFDLAIQQYQAAKLCKSISRSQQLLADSLIQLTTKQQTSRLKIITRKY